MRPDLLAPLLEAMADAVRLAVREELAAQRADDAEPGWVSASTVAGWLEVTPETARALLKDAAIPSRMFGERVKRYRRADVEAWLRSGPVTEPPLEAQWANGVLRRVVRIPEGARVAGRAR